MGPSSIKYLLHIPPGGYRLWVYIHTLASCIMRVFPSLDKVWWNASEYYLRGICAVNIYGATFNQAASQSALHYTYLIEISVE